MNARKPTRRAVRRVRRPRMRSMRARTPFFFSRRFGSTTRKGSDPIREGSRPPGGSAPRRGAGFAWRVRLLVLVERADDLAHQVMTDHVPLVQVDEREI